MNAPQDSSPQGSTPEESPRSVADAAGAVLADLDATRVDREERHRHLHRNPELSGQEYETCRLIRDALARAGFEVHPIAETGTAGVLRNGDGPVIALRADIDALPITENSGKDYASTAVQTDASGREVPVAHACGHDVHISALLAAAEAFSAHRDPWAGTLLVLFQPAEEDASGARAMVADGLTDRVPAPEAVLAQHVLGTVPGGHVGTREGTLLTAAASIEITVPGLGGHGAMPHLTVNPLLIASNIVTRLQGIVAREVPPGQTAVVSAGSIHAGTGASIIADSAVLHVNTRAFDPDLHERIQRAIERVVRGECLTAGVSAEPSFRYHELFPRTDTDPATTRTVRAAFDAYFGDRATELPSSTASEDFSILPEAFGVPFTYWAIGGFADMGSAPPNHTGTFAPDLQPTLDRGTEAMVVAACAWLARP